MKYVLRTVAIRGPAERKLEAEGYIGQDRCADMLGDSEANIRHRARCGGFPGAIIRDNFAWVPVAGLQAELDRRRCESSDDRDSRLAMRNPGDLVNRSVLEAIERRREEKFAADMIRMGIPVEVPDPPATVTRAASMPVQRSSGQDPANDFLSRFGGGAR
jgi:hypothetical protein